MVAIRKDIESHDDFLRAIGDLYRGNKLRRRGSLRIVMVYSRISIDELPKISSWKRHLKGFTLSTPKKIGASFYKVKISLGGDEETFYVNTSQQEMWMLHFLSTKQMDSSLTYRLVKLAYPHLTQVSLSSSELITILDKLEEKYQRRPVLMRLVAKQFFNSKVEVTQTYRKRTLVLYQDDCEPMLKVLRDSFPIFPEIMTMRVYKGKDLTNSQGLLYTAAISKKGYVRLFGGPRVRYFFDDVSEFIATPAVNRLDEFKDRAPKLENFTYVSKPLEITVGPNLYLGLAELRETLLKHYLCVTYHTGNPYLDMAVIDASSGSEFRMIASGESVIVMPTKYRAPSSLIRLTRMIMETVGGEREEDYDQAKPKKP